MFSAIEPAYAAALKQSPGAPPRPFFGILTSRLLRGQPAEEKWAAWGPYNGPSTNLENHLKIL